MHNGIWIESPSYTHFEKTSQRDIYGWIYYYSTSEGIPFVRPYIGRSNYHHTISIL